MQISYQTSTKTNCLGCHALAPVPNPSVYSRAILLPSSPRSRCRDRLIPPDEWSGQRRSSAACACACLDRRQRRRQRPAVQSSSGTHDPSHWHLAIRLPQPPRAGSWIICGVDCECRQRACFQEAAIGLMLTEHLSHPVASQMV